METPQKLTKAEKRELKKLEWQEKLEKEKKAQQYKKISLWIGVGVVVVLGILGLAWLVNSPASQNTTSALSAPAVSKEDLFTFGNPKAKVVLTEYGDYQCPACKAYAPIVKQLIEEKQKDILFVYRYFPLVNVHQNAKISAQAGWAANKQGKFWEMSEALYANQDDWAQGVNPKSVFVSYAEKLGMDTNKFLTDINSNEASKFVDASLNKATEMGLQSTPSFFINGKKIASPNSYDELKKLIEDALQNESTK